MNILLAGGSGNVGRNLIPILEAKGHRVWVLTRNPKNARDIAWNPAQKFISDSLQTPIDVIINLNGFSVSNRWTVENKKRMYTSRVDANDTLLAWAQKQSQPPRTWINASAIGIYPSKPTLQDENDGVGSGFLADLCSEWELFQRDLDDLTRIVILRIGIVLDRHSGALPTLKIPTAWGVGSAIGDGKQYMSWIDMEDLCRMIDFSIEHPIQGVYNAVSPEPVSNETFSKTLAQVMRKPFWAPKVPAFFVKTLMGEMASMVLNSHRISAKKIMDAGFQFSYPTLTSSLKHQLNK